MLRVVESALSYVEETVVVVLFDSSTEDFGWVWDIRELLEPASRRSRDL